MYFTTISTQYCMTYNLTVFYGAIKETDNSWTY